jgi:outer membrane lipoprotein SlyB
MRRAAPVLVLALALAACTHPTRETYTADDVGRIVDTSRGTIVSARAVEIRGGENSGIGAVAGGAAAGSVAAAAVDKPGAEFAATVIAGLVGAGLGFLAEEEARSRDGIEYVVQTDKGRTITIVQNRGPDEQPIEAGADVLIQYGREYTRVVNVPEGLPPEPVDDGRDHNGLDTGRGVAPEPRQAEPRGPAPRASEPRGSEPKWSNPDA